MLSATSIARLGEVHPSLAQRIKSLDALIPSVNLQITQGFRTWAQQQSLYAQGRTAPGPIVTNCPAGFSWHNFGLAVDLVPEDIIPGQPDWDSNNPIWQKMIAVGISVGLVSGSTWRTFPDMPHFQITGKLPVNPDDETRYLFREGGIQAVWDAAAIESI